jgi:hypothetical protein
MTHSFRCRRDRAVKLLSLGNEWWGHFKSRYPNRAREDASFLHAWVSLISPVAG